MSVLIKGMQMPKDGTYWCEIGVAGDIAVITIHGEDRKSFHLIELPDHGELIDKDALEKEFIDLSNDEWNKKTGTSWARAFEEAAYVVFNAPIIIPAERSEE